MMRTRGEKIFNIFNITTLFIFILTTLYPLWYVFIISITDTTAVSTANIFLLPGPLTTDSYRAVLLNPLLLSGFKISFLRVIVGVGVTMINCTTMAYVLSRKHFKAKRFFNLFCVIVLFVSGGMIPFYLVSRELGMINNFWGLIFPHAFDPFGIILIRNYFNTTPRALEESARIDGANDFIIFLRIVIPISVPILATMALFWSVWFWNDFINAAFFVTKQELYPIQVILLQIIKGMSNANSISKLRARGLALRTNGEAVKNAAIIVSIVPILLVYPFLQKYFVHGLKLGSVKE